MPPTFETVEVDFITPRHLAGGGNPAWITIPLHRACGWSHGNDPLMPRVILSSPGQKALLRLEPDPDGPWWTLQHAPGPGRPPWSASFGARTPVELIAAVTDALTDPAPPGDTPFDPYEPLRQSGWTPASTDNGLESPGGIAYVQRPGNAEEPGAWFVTSTLGPNRPVWQARFGTHTPSHLITAFTTALADPAAVPRANGLRSLPTYNPKLITVTRREVPTVQVASALEERVRSLTVRGTSPPAVPNTLRRPPFTNGRSR
ncbi:DUF317 domain-containing protein [Streptomyces sp. NPDC055239]